MTAPWGSKALAVVFVAAAGLRAQDAAHAQTGTVEGRVLGPLGAPMVGVEVRAAVWPALDDTVGRTQTDGDGMFVLAHLPTRSLSILATAPGHTIGWGTASLSAERSAGSATLRLWEAVTLRGRVVGEDGAPVEGAVVLGTKDFTWFAGGFRPPEARTDVDGRFEVAGVPLGDCTVRAWAPGHVMREEALVAFADREVEVSLARGDGVVLAVHAEDLDAADAERVRVGIYATRKGSGFRLPDVIESGVLDASGRWRIAGLPDAEWNVELDSPDFTFDPRSVRTEAGETGHALEFAATRIGALRLTGTLRSAAGEPLGGETLLCRTRRSQSMNGGTPGRAVTDVEGRFVMDASLVPGEPYSLHLVDSAFVLRQEKVDGHTGKRDLRYLVRYEDTADPDRALALEAVPAAFVKARLVDRGGRPVPFVWTELQVRPDHPTPPRWMAMAYATSRRDGVAAFPGVHGLELDLRVHAEGDSGAGSTEPFQVRPGETRELVVTVERPGTVAGRLSDAVGRALPGVRVVLRDFDVESGQQMGGGWKVVPTDREGRYVFVGVPPGGHRVDAGGLDGELVAVSGAFAVAPGATVTVDLKADR